MTYYRIHSKKESFLVTVGADIILQVPAKLSTFIGRPWSELRQVLEALDTIIEPYDLEKGQSDFITFDDAEYEIKWNDDRTIIRRISKHKNGKIHDIQFSSLPFLIRRALC